MIATAAVGGLSLLLVQMFENSNRYVKHTELKLSGLDYQGIIEDVFRHNSACTRTFGKVPAPVNREGFGPSDDNILDTDGIYNADGDLLWGKDKHVASQLRLKSMKIPAEKHDYDLNSPVANFTAINAAQNKGFFEVHVELEKTEGAKKSLGGDTRLLKFYITAKVKDVSGGDLRIESCQLSGSGGPSGQTLTSTPWLVEGTDFNWPTPGNTLVTDLPDSPAVLSESCIFNFALKVKQIEAYESCAGVAIDDIYYVPSLVHQADGREYGFSVLWDDGDSKYKYKIINAFSAHGIPIGVGTSGAGGDCFIRGDIKITSLCEL